VRINRDLYCLNNWFPCSYKFFVEYSFATNAVKLNWFDMHFAIQKGVFSPRSAVEHALHEIECRTNIEKSENELMLLYFDEFQDHLIHPYIDELADGISNNDKEISPYKLMYVMLKWIYENKDDFDNPFCLAEDIYSSYFCPPSIEKFAGFGAANVTGRAREKLFEEWANYIKTESLLWL